jgi:PleD family two-component response regulator
MKDHETIDDLLKEADDNLYLAKQRGKNRVIGR